MPKKDKDSHGYYGFDPSGLERAATVPLPPFSYLLLGCKISGPKSQCERRFRPCFEKGVHQAIRAYREH